MSHNWNSIALIAVLTACAAPRSKANATSTEDGDSAEMTSSGAAASDATDEADSLPLQPEGASDGDASGAVPPSPMPDVDDDFVRFTDPASAFVTGEVHDADREVVHFDPALGAMIGSASGDRVSGWTTNSLDLSWSRSGVAFRVRFGTEQGERRAYFTETATGTICNLNISGPDLLSISGTDEPPPNE